MFGFGPVCRKCLIADTAVSLLSSPPQKGELDASERAALERDTSEDSAFLKALDLRDQLIDFEKNREARTTVKSVCKQLQYINVVSIKITTRLRCYH